MHGFMNVRSSFSNNCGTMIEGTVYSLKHAACTRKENVHVAVCSEFLRTRDYFRGLGVDRKVILVLILHKQSVRVWSESKWGTT
jgi:hypothetical protein